MSRDQVIEAKVARLEDLRKYQSYYGPNTPYPVIVEINELETELRQLLQSRAAPGTGKATRKKNRKKATSLWRMSPRTFDAIATIIFISLVFLFGSIIAAAYAQTRPNQAASVEAGPGGATLFATLRPTFTPTADPNNPSEPQAAAVTVVENSNPEVVTENSNLPPADRRSTEIPTTVPTLTPSSTPEATATVTPTEAPPPTPTSPPPPPQPTQPPAPPPAASAASAVSTAPPAPSYPFMMAEQGNRVFQSTSYHVITIYVAAVSEGNMPIGDLKVIGDHVPSGQHAESGLSDWHWSATNCLDCGYIKQGNLKFEPGNFTDGVWNIYLADKNGTQLSPTVPLSYSADPEQWVWDFVIFRRISGEDAVILAE